MQVTGSYQLMAAASIGQYPGYLGQVNEVVWTILAFWCLAKCGPWGGCSGHTRRCVYSKVRFNSDYIDHLIHQASALYLFLVTVGDSRGLSYFSDTTIGERLSVVTVVFERSPGHPGLLQAGYTPETDLSDAGPGLPAGTGT